MASPYTLATLGSHSALQILKGAKDEGFHTLLITLNDRADFYRQFPFIDECLTILSYDQFGSIESTLKQKNAIIIPHGSFVAYLGMEGNKNLKLPYFGNKQVLDWEASRDLQLEWMQDANINVPKTFRSGEAIDHPVIVKSDGAAGGSGYFVAKNQAEFDRKKDQFKNQPYIIQEYLVGVTMYPHFFYSPLTQNLELLSADRRYETNADALGRLGLDIDPSFVVVGNIPIVIRESLLPELYDMARKVINSSQKLINPQGLYGPFCLETIVTPNQKIYLIEISCRIVAGTNAFVNGSPYSHLLYDEPMSTGRRIAREIKTAIKQNKLNLILN